ncbi:vWA domain-containing protein [Altibacter lentus]|uniref:vWA domain-containing protein n=1 Tax=Altibacter lentus TaxID=1223410 RepID=UPI00054FEEA7|nr:vWA domain-containing protein [Altibacter lentus]
MTAEIILYIVIAAVIALAVAVFMYGYKVTYSASLKWVFGVLRFLTIFLILLLLINPKFRSETYTVVKPKLPVLIDNSSSISELDQTSSASEVLLLFQNDDDLNDKFDVSYYSFGSDFNALDSLSFSEKNTNISKALTGVDRLFRNEIAPTVLITDGNQTIGNDYEFSVSTFKNAVFPVVLGDSITYTDLKIERLNTNRYAFLKNDFPVEAIVVYNGSNTFTTQFSVTQGAAVVYRENISFSETDNSKTISFTLPASSVGLQKYTAQIIPQEEERNKVNNSKRFAVEVIDQSTNVLIVSSIIHPDLGALQKSITTNEQRKVTVKKPGEAVSLLNDHQLVLLYQPDRAFSSVYQELERLQKNVWVITGMQTDWNFLNAVQNNYSKEASSEPEDVSGMLHPNYGTFAVEDIGFDSFRPLTASFGLLEMNVPHETLLEQTINGFTTGNPMLATFEIDGRRGALWDGEGLWKWRAETYLATNEFEAFDQFIGKLVQYLASNKRRSRLEVSSETFYYNNNPIKVTAQYFDKNFVFDPRASLSIAVLNTETEARVTFPMLLRNNFYEVDLNSLPAGEYQYTVLVKDEATSRSGNFTILDFNVEQQFLNANVTKLERVATNSKGSAFYASETEKLIANLVADDRFQSIQKSEQKVVPLIDWKYLLGLIVLLLASEWFIRKYNGLI